MAKHFEIKNPNWNEKVRAELDAKIQPFLGEPKLFKEEPSIEMYDEEETELTEPFKLNWNWDDHKLSEKDEEALKPLFGMPRK